jgi:hypothetical protein
VVAIIISIFRRHEVESNDKPKLSKSQRRKARRYGKKPLGLPSSDGCKKLDTYVRIDKLSLLKPPTEAGNSSDEAIRRDFILSLLKPRVEEDHSLDELEHERRHWPLLPGSYETGKRR